MVDKTEILHAFFLARFVDRRPLRNKFKSNVRLSPSLREVLPISKLSLYNDLWTKPSEYKSQQSAEFWEFWRVSVCDVVDEV